MAKPGYEGYSVAKQMILLREKFGTTNVYAQNAQSLLNKATGFIRDYDFTLNPYRGCQYACSYCYAAAFSPNSKMQLDWGNWVIFKENSVQLIEKELNRWFKKNPDRPPRIYMSTVTDPYQPLESKIQLTRQLLEVMLNYQPTLVIQTRSPMISRDLDLLQQFQRLRINMSIPTGSEGVRRDFEPKSPSLQARLNALSKLRYNIPFRQGSDIRFSITITPLLPTLPKDQETFIIKLGFVDRIVLQPFHGNLGRSLVASTRDEAIALKKKYAWWYDEEAEQYQQFKQKLEVLLEDIEILEGKEGFGYD